MDEPAFCSSWPGAALAVSPWRWLRELFPSLLPSSGNCTSWTKNDLMIIFLELAGKLQLCFFIQTHKICLFMTVGMTHYMTNSGLNTHICNAMSWTMLHNPCEEFLLVLQPLFVFISSVLARWNFMKICHPNSNLFLFLYMLHVNHFSLFMPQQGQSIKVLQGLCYWNYSSVTIVIPFSLQCCWMIWWYSG